MNEQKGILEAVNRWIKNSITLKLATITFLMLLLLIPSGMIESIIYERESLSRSAILETSTKWANEQVIKGPILMVPLLYEKNVDGETSTSRKAVKVLPETLAIEGKVAPHSLRRGIYEVVVYGSELSAAGTFSLGQEVSEEYLKAIEWDQASIVLGISDLRGIEDELLLQIDDKGFPARPGGHIPGVVDSGVTFDLGGAVNASQTSMNFHIDMKIQGSRNLQFVPLGGVTTVSLSSTWSDPSFDGAFLPDDRVVTADGFEAEWKVLELNRNFPQTWIEGPQNLDASTFGVRLLLPLDDYQKAMRSAKYGMMVIAMTFLIFFLVEMIAGKKIHPFQYTLVGLAICLFYVLLISLSEHLAFNSAYLISSVAVTLMITLYSLSVFRHRKFSMALLLGLLGTYGFLFVTLQVADYALLMGALGLTMLLAATMYLTRNIDWYNIKRTTPTL
ncbi:MAG: cell envelope integrity protein CreD [Bacteroidota bacterium]